MSQAAAVTLLYKATRKGEVDVPVLVPIRGATRSNCGESLKPQLPS